MDWRHFLEAGGLGEKAGGRPADGRSPFQRDADRVVFSSAFRRLQNKTQVHPLPDTDYVRTRLTHSMEVASVGRSLGGQVARRLIAGDSSLAVELPHLAADLGDIVAAACLAHDIGNPPFGHTGEQAIQQWFAMQGAAAFQGELTQAEEADFLYFEGNAQGFRIVTRLQMDRDNYGMRLTGPTLGTFLKYPCSSLAAARSSEARKNAYGGRKKHGFFQAESEYFHEIATKLGMPELPEQAGAYRRTPLAYLVEAADDICYRVIDVEDGVKLGRIGFSEAEALLAGIIGGDLGSRYAARRNDEKLSTLRSRAIGSLIDACCDAFVEPANGFLDASQSQALVDKTRHAIPAKDLKTLAMQRVYRWERTLAEELKGIAVLQRLLDLFIPALNAPPRHVVAERLCDLVPHLPGPEKPRYQRLLAVTDYISGMTDRYAYDMHDRLREVCL